uniref:NADH dehydrogenase subunit 4L n=1 Tax=Desmaulus extinctorium TaxID=211681 RepID=UPI002551CCD5|nr:NADH dehydrogenase subunit 4L [Desmaulus extinctorium]WGH72836.1 NADH dehydrogenase subunit 4L [Desmaulus extinctorium]
MEINLFHLSVMSFYGFFFALLALSLQKKHFLSILLSLEAMMLNLFILMFSMVSNICFNGESVLILITLGVCEGSLGLSLLVAIIRCKGNDYVSSFSLQKC